MHPNEQPDLKEELKDLRAEIKALKKTLRTIHALAVAPNWDAKKRWHIAELSSP